MQPSDGTGLPVKSLLVNGDISHHSIILQYLADNYYIFDEIFYFRTSFKLAPSINGKEIDLYLLYWLVTAQGGWERVRDFFTLVSISVKQNQLDQLK